MAPPPPPRPVTETVSQPPLLQAAQHEPANAEPGQPPNRRQGWPEGALEQAVALQRSLCIGDRDWHALKRQRPRRAAEQISAALVQLLAGDDPAGTAPSEARQQAISLLEHSLGWLRAELSDPGCPSHRR